jgi:hypothetical protein
VLKRAFVRTYVLHLTDQRFPILSTGSIPENEGKFPNLFTAESLESVEEFDGIWFQSIAQHLAVRNIPDILLGSRKCVDRTAGFICGFKGIEGFQGVRVFQQLPNVRRMLQEQ